MNLRQHFSTSLRSIVLASAVAVAATSAFAHTTLQSASPAVNATVSTQPTKLLLNFGEPVMLMNIKLVDAQQKNIHLNYKVTSDLQLAHTVALPALPDSTYTVIWTTMGKDGHNMSGKYNFTLKQAQ